MAKPTKTETKKTAEKPKVEAPEQPPKTKAELAEQLKNVVKKSQAYQ